MGTNYIIYEHVYGIPIDSVHEELQEDCEANEMSYDSAKAYIDWLNEHYPTDGYGRKRFLYVWRNN